MTNHVCLFLIKQISSVPEKNNLKSKESKIYGSINPPSPACRIKRLNKGSFKNNAPFWRAISAGALEGPIERSDKWLRGFDKSGLSWKNTASLLRQPVSYLTLMLRPEVENVLSTSCHLRKTPILFLCLCRWVPLKFWVFLHHNYTLLIFLTLWHLRVLIIW